MATVITVHGTFAHSDIGTAAPASEQVRSWWQPDSDFKNDIRNLLNAPKGTLEVENFEWSGENSEVSRREAGRRLDRRLRELETKGEPYCLIGHSHGGSVIAAALLRSAARNEPLNGLKRWITVGTPFVNLKKELLLFTRLDLLRKVIFVASAMLFLMFIVFYVADLLMGERVRFTNTFWEVFAISAGMMSLPILICYVVLRYLDGRSLFHYRRSVRERAREIFGPRWLSLTHADDEAVQGLAYLPSAKLQFFHREFAMPAITLISVVVLPLVYLIALTSPTMMVGIADLLKTRLYSESSPEAVKALRDLRLSLRAAQRDGTSQSPQGSGDWRKRTSEERQAIWANYREERRKLAAIYPNLESIERAGRFSQRFFERDNKPCEGGKLCGGGADFRLNSALLLHVVTDELSWALGAEDTRRRWRQSATSLLLPALLVPVIAGLVALVIMIVIWGIASLISRVLSEALNRLTTAEVKRAAFGNDTEGEIAVGSVDRPVWLDKSPPRLPASLCDLVTSYSNTVATQSLTRFRRAIARLASAEPRHSAESAITTYFTWKELVHAAYFDVPEFRKLIAQAIGRAEGFAPTAKFQADPDYARTAQWLAEIEEGPRATRAAGETAPTPADAGAVAVAVASTVKAEP